MFTAYDITSIMNTVASDEVKKEALKLMGIIVEHTLTTVNTTGE